MKNIQKDYNNYYRKMVKRFLIYIVCIFFVFIVTSTVFSLLNIDVWAIILFNVVLGGGLVFVAELIYRKREQKRQVEKLMSDKSDPFA